MKVLSTAMLLLACGVAAGAPAAPCSSPEHGQFDFWLGDWAVTTPDGKEAGRNRIEKSNDGCVLHERWQSARSTHRGESFNIYDAPRKVWHQTWVDNGGLLLTLEGGLRGGSMVLEGERPADGGAERHRITWTPQPDGTLRQHWESSVDQGKSWKTLFDGRYRRRKP